MYHKGDQLQDKMRPVEQMYEARLGTVWVTNSF